MMTGDELGDELRDELRDEMCGEASAFAWLARDAVGLDVVVYVLVSCSKR